MQKITQGVTENNGNTIKNWPSTVPLYSENLVNPLPQKTVETVSSYSGLFLDSDQIPTLITLSAGSVWAPDFKDFLGMHNISSQQNR